MKVVLFGASGMVGQGVLRECLRDPGVTRVVAVSRRAAAPRHDKLHEITLPDLAQLTPYADLLRDCQACFFCLGVTSAGLSEARYRQVTYDLTLAVAHTLVELNPAMILVYVSGAGTDSSGSGRSMWARVKGQTENALLRLPFKAAYMFRPGIIQPLHGITSRTRSYRILYAALGPLLPLLRKMLPHHVTTTEQIGRAMIQAARYGAPRTILETRDINAL